MSNLYVFSFSSHSLMLISLDIFSIKYAYSNILLLLYCLGFIVASQYRPWSAFPYSSLANNPPIIPLTIEQEIIWPHYCKGHQQTDEYHHVQICIVPLLSTDACHTFIHWPHVPPLHPIYCVYQGSEVSLNLETDFEIPLFLLPLLIIQHIFRRIPPITCSIQFVHLDVKYSACGIAPESIHAFVDLFIIRKV